MTSIEKINLLVDKIDAKLQAKNIQTQKKPEKSPTILRQENLEKIAKIYEKLELSKNHPDFSTIFNYTAMNLAGIGLKEENFGEIYKGKYVQLISIAYELNSSGKRVTKNSSLGYYGKAEKITEKTKNSIIEFVLRWRYEKSFQHSNYYETLLQKLH